MCIIGISSLLVIYHTYFHCIQTILLALMYNTYGAEDGTAMLFPISFNGVQKLVPSQAAYLLPDNLI